MLSGSPCPAKAVQRAKRLDTPWPVVGGLSRSGIHKTQGPAPKQGLVFYGTPKGIRTPVTAVRGRCPRPLDHGGKMAAELGFEPRRNGSEPFVLPLHYSATFDAKAILSYGWRAVNPCFTALSVEIATLIAHLVADYTKLLYTYRWPSCIRTFF